MTVAQIRSNISYNENLISQYNSSINKLDDELDELELLRKKIVNLQTNFGDKQSTRKSNLASFSSKALRSKIFTSYISGMNSLLSDTSFNSAYSNLSTGEQNIKNEMYNLLKEIEEYEAQISYRKNRNVYWNQQLSIALAAESVTGG